MLYTRLTAVELRLEHTGSYKTFYPDPMFIICIFKLNFWVFGFLGVNGFHRKESDFASRPDRAYKLEIQIMACLFQDLQIGNPDNCLGKGGIL